MSGPSQYYWNDKVQQGQYTVLRLAWNITGAKAASLINDGFPVVTSFDAGLDTLAEITAALPDMTTDEFVAATAFGSTAMGTGAFGFVIDMGGQVRRVRWMTVHVSGTASSVPLISSVIGQTTALTDSLASQVTAGSLGNVAGHILVTGLDGLTSGVIEINLHLELK